MTISWAVANLPDTSVSSPSTSGNSMNTSPDDLLIEPFYFLQGFLRCRDGLLPGSSHLHFLLVGLWFRVTSPRGHCSTYLGTVQLWTGPSSSGTVFCHIRVPFTILVKQTAAYTSQNWYREALHYPGPWGSLTAWGLKSGSTFSVYTGGLYTGGIIPWTGPGEGGT